MRRTEMKRKRRVMKRLLGIGYWVKKRAWAKVATDRSWRKTKWERSLLTRLVNVSVTFLSQVGRVCQSIEKHLISIVDQHSYYPPTLHVVYSKEESCMPMVCSITVIMPLFHPHAPISTPANTTEEKKYLLRMSIKEKCLDPCLHVLTSFLHYRLHKTRCFGRLTKAALPTSDCSKN